MPSAEGEESAADEQLNASLVPRDDGGVNPAAAVSSYFSSAAPSVGVDVDLAVAPRRKRKKATPLPLPEEDEEQERQATMAPNASEESRRLFQKLWTDDDEMTILEGFLEFTSQRGTTHADYQHDTGPFYEQIRRRLQLDFSRSQLSEKLRRLKKKYRNMATRKAADEAFVFRSPHDQATFDIAGKIWNPTFKRASRSHVPAEEVNGPNPTKSFELGGAVPVPDSAACQDGSFHSEEATKSIPAAPESESADVKHPAPGTAAAAAHGNPANTTLMQNQRAALILPCSTEPQMTTPGESSAELMTTIDSFWPLFKHPRFGVSGGTGLCGLSSGTAVAFGERWKQQLILELEVYLKRVELVHQQVKSKLAELRSGMTDCVES